MQKRIEVTNFQQLEKTLVIEGADINIDTSTLRASGEMLVDSDSLAFIYKLENEQEYIYVSLPISVWPSLKTVLEEEQAVILHLPTKEIELTNIIPELRYLLHNIEGNANYGEEMVELVENTFLQR
ncbi:hypothetical protein ACLM5H_01355 [Fredinandcohnia humi]